MFIAHIPVGLALARRITRQPLTGVLIGVASLGAIFPDLDLIRFYIFDNHQRHHHDYWTHIPSVWVGIMTAWYVLRRLLGRSFGLMPAVFLLVSCRIWFWIRWRGKLNGFGRSQTEASI